MLAIDQGTSGTKAIVLCPERGVLAQAVVDLRPDYGPAGEVEQDPIALLDSVIESGQRALALAGEPVQAVGLANQGETVLAWDRATGRPLTPAIVWQDRRAASICTELAEKAQRAKRAENADRSADLARLTGLPLDPYFAAPKMTWLRRTLTRDGVVTTSDSWLIHQLTGEFVTDAGTASRTGILDLDRGAWSPEALACYELDDEPLPRVVDCAGLVGLTSRFGASVPLTGVVVDQQAALAAQGCLDPGTAKCTYGTGAFLLAQLGARAARSTAGLATSIAWQLDGARAYCLDGQVYTVSSAVRWLVELGVLADAADLDRVAATVPDSGGVLMVPAFAGLAAPHWAADARAVLLGAGLGTTAGHLVRALLEGIAGQVAELAQAVADDLGAALSTLRVDGGLTRCRTLMQAQADLLQVPVEVYPGADATAAGAAAFARVGLDPGLSLAEALPAWTPSARYEPRISADRAAEHRDRLAGAVAVAAATQQHPASP